MCFRHTVRAFEYTLWKNARGRTIQSGMERLRKVTAEATERLTELDM